MSEQGGGWTFDTLLAHVRALFAESDKRYEQRFSDSKEAITKAETASEKRFEGVNEFRATLGDQQRTLMPRSEAELRFSALEKRIYVLEQTDTRQGGQRFAVREIWGWIVAAIGIVIAAVALWR